MLIRRRGLSATDLAAVADLEQRVVAVDGGRLKLSWPSLWSRPADEVNDLLWSEDGVVLGFAGIYAFGSTPEIAGMVDPTARRRGIGSALLAAALDELADRGERRALVVCPRTGAGGAAFVAAHGGTPDHSEHALQLDGDPTPGPEDPATALRPAAPEAASTVNALLQDGFGYVDPVDLTEPADHLLIERDGDTVGYLRASLDLDADPPRGDVYGFVVRADLRGRGIGRDVLRRTCRDLRDRGARVVGLEVDTDNDHALGLYTSLGFRPVVTEDYLGLTVGG